MAVLEGFDFFPLHCDDNGALAQPAELQMLTAAIVQRPATDVVFIAHGFRNDENDATGLYSEFLRTFRAHLDRAEFAGVKARTFVVGRASTGHPRRFRRASTRVPSRGLTMPRPKSARSGAGCSR